MCISLLSDTVILLGIVVGELLLSSQQSVVSLETESPKQFSAAGSFFAESRLQASLI